MTLWKNPLPLGSVLVKSFSAARYLGSYLSFVLVEHCKDIEQGIVEDLDTFVGLGMVKEKDIVVELEIVDKREIVVALAIVAD